MSVHLCPTCGRRPSERIGVTTDMVNECGYEIEARYPTHACPDPIHDFADTHAAEVARLRGALEDGRELARRVVEFARIDEKRRIPCRYCRSLPGTLHVMCAVPLARKIIDTALAPAARKEGDRG